MAATLHPPDVIDYLAGIAGDTPLANLRAGRPEVVRYAQSSYQVLLAPDDPGGLSRQERELVALRVAVLTATPGLAAWQRERLQASGVDESTIAGGEQFPASPALPPRLAVILDHTDRLTLAPGSASADHIAALRAAGLGAAEIVTLAQLIAFLNFQVRVLAGLRLLGGNSVATEPAAAGRAATSVPPRHRFTLAAVGWRPWLETVDEVGATPEQAALLDEVVPNPDARPYYALLAHDAPALRERTRLYNAIMYGPGGARRADRELSTVATSRFNGCVYCASVHTRRYVQLTKDETTVQRLLDDGLGAELDERKRALVDYALALTRDPASATTAALAPLRRVGFSEAEILDVTHAIAMFAWANRLLQTLGEVEPLAGTSR